MTENIKYPLSSFWRLFAFDIKTFQKFYCGAIGIFSDLSDGIKTVFVANAEHGAERKIRADLLLIDLTAVTGKLGVEIGKLERG